MAGTTILVLSETLNEKRHGTEEQFRQEEHGSVSLKGPTLNPRQRCGELFQWMEHNNEAYAH